MNSTKYLIFATILVAFVVTSIKLLMNNLTDLDYLSIAFQQTPMVINQYPAETCRQTWLQSAINLHSGLQLSPTATTTVLNCGISYLSLLQSIAPTSKGYALIASTIYPDNATVWFWVAEAYSSNDPAFARQAYLQSVDINPKNGLAWCRLGWSYEEIEDKQSALNSFLNCCVNGDPGANGCYGAGRLTENMGDTVKAIQYYRMSHGKDSLKRADELEAQLNNSK